MDTIELIGYIATLLLVISFVPNNVKTIRSLNCVACVFFVIYGILLGNKWPIIISNGMIACIHLYYLFKSKATALNS
ncbi:hypothetical protein PIECOFPK_01534 [Mycovorax composti]|jgi:hypothetical protein|uniref:Uroporphyrinogen decarboxylase n=2 Tax=Chitinophagaceae TaxID=563835 RepID=A0ABZ2EKJ6_9BACT